MCPGESRPWARQAALVGLWEQETLEQGREVIAQQALGAGQAGALRHTAWLVCFLPLGKVMEDLGCGPHAPLGRPGRRCLGGSDTH